LFGFAVRLKKNYANFSAVLLSGAMAIMYFITYAAYSFYDLIPLAPAFGLMVFFTAFTVAAALRYDNQVIALIGLVGAYAVPFVLSPEEGDARVLFSYVTIVNLGILVIAFRKSWKLLYYTAFVLTWLIYLSWFALDYNAGSDFQTGLAFAIGFFMIFYAIFLAYKLLLPERFGALDILVLLANAFLLYGFGYVLVDDLPNGDSWLGLFTVGNALLHAAASIIVFTQRLEKRDLFYFISGLVLVFLTISIPVQFDGTWVTMLWAGGAAVLFWVGRTKQVGVYERLGYALLYLAFFSLLHDWISAYSSYDPGVPESRIRLLFNAQFLTSLLCIASFGAITYLIFNRRYTSGIRTDRNWFLRGIFDLASYTVPMILLVTIYGSFMTELGTFWDQRYADSAQMMTLSGEPGSTLIHNDDLISFKSIWQINYSLLFLSFLSFVNMRFVRNSVLGVFTLVANLVAIWIFLTLGLFTLGSLGESYSSQAYPEYYPVDTFYLVIRYVSYLFLAMLSVVTWRYVRDPMVTLRLKAFFDLMLHLTMLWIASAELILWLDLAQSGQSDKLGLSILWGSYALLLIVLGIWKQKKYLRISAIILFGCTLIKLFFYDLTHLTTISKTIVFVSLGILLLVISFLYQKYHRSIFG
jgi:uncharacterized membrane protein